MKMKSLKNALIVLSFMSVTAIAGDGHDHSAPGAIPPAPNGGKIAEAAHSGAHQGGAEGMELFAEAKLQGSVLKIYALGLDPNNAKVWKILTPGPKLSLSEVTMEYPRSKKTEKVEVKATAGGWEANIGTPKDHRMMMLATFQDGAEKKQAKIQLEK